MRILAIAGSVGAASSNKSLLRALSSVAPDGVQVILYDRLGEIPPFNPDLDGPTPPPSIVGFRALLQNADGLLFSIPEYARGVPGVLKNALDWVVASGELIGKAVGVLNPAPPASQSPASLTETIRTMSGDVIDEASVTLPVGDRDLAEADLASDPSLASALGTSLRALVDAIRRKSALPSG